MANKLSVSVFFLPALVALLLLTSTPAGAGPPTHVPCTVTTAPVTCLAANGGRQYLSVQNLSATVVAYCTFDGQTPSATLGNLIPANGGGLWWDVEPTTPKGIVRCVTGTGTTTLSVTEETQ